MSNFRSPLRMANDAKKLAGVALLVLRATRGKLGVGGVVGLVIAAVLYVAVIQPWAQKSLGVDLPTIGDSTPVATSTPDRSPAPAPDVADDLRDLLAEVGRDRYRSPAGLVYTPGSQHGHRLKHVMHHASDDPDRPGQHGVFDADDPREVILLIDEAYEQALSGRDTRSRREEGRMVYNVDLGRRIGYVGGESGKRRGRPAAEHVRLVVQDDRLITAFPFIP